MDSNSSNQDAQQGNEVESYHERRRIQNRIAQRKYRERNKEERRRAGKSREGISHDGPPQTPELVDSARGHRSRFQQTNNDQPSGASIMHDVNASAPLTPYSPTYSMVPQKRAKAAMATEHQESLFPLHFSPMTTQPQYTNIDNPFRPTHAGATPPMDYASAMQFPSFRDPYIERSMQLPDPRLHPWSSSDANSPLWSAPLNVSAPSCSAHPQCQAAHAETFQSVQPQNIKPQSSDRTDIPKGTQEDGRRRSQSQAPSKRSRPRGSTASQPRHSEAQRPATTTSITSSIIDRVLLLQLRDQLAGEKRLESKNKEVGRKASTGTQRNVDAKSMPWKPAEFKSELLARKAVIEKRALRAIDRWRDWYNFGVKIGLYKHDPSFDSDIRMIISRLEFPPEIVIEKVDAIGFDDTAARDTQEYDSLDDSSDWSDDHDEEDDGYGDEDSGSDHDDGSEKDDDRGDGKGRSRA